MSSHNVILVLYFCYKYNVKASLLMHGLRLMIISRINEIKAW